MKRITLLATLMVIMSIFYAHAQQIEVLTEHPPVSLRGLSVVTNDIIWVSGSHGTVGKSTDGGATWKWSTVPGFEKSDFRDIEAFDDKTAVIMAIAEPAYILRTTDGGESWKVVYENKRKGMFMDAMDFFDDRHGSIVGDAIGGKLFVTHTHDGGVTWQDEPEQTAPAADSVEGCFASSGTNIRQTGKDDYVFVSEGRQSRSYFKNTFHVIPFGKGNGSSGANSIAVRQVGGKMKWVVVGGDFRLDSVRRNNCLLSEDLGKTWTAPVVSPLGYRSCVEFISDHALITCGLNGVDVSSDDGKTWKTISTTGFHACRKAKKGSAVFLSGNKGRIGRLVQ